MMLFIAVEVKFKTSFPPCSLLPAPFPAKDYVLNHTSLGITNKQNFLNTASSHYSLLPAPNSLCQSVY
ncbi:hypothetical protein [Moorena sp. SIO4A5]|uniref:hypothetical protein n=1 Tax=Moorena sp. SIO4A5 TaxID=2607838 RepID=UPI0013C5AD34|nr:hypothetical protein [Moorena sp. SIO4A5]NEO21048.1 hypothetical protein [Moorena sp. SIO4A5]